MKPLRTLTSYLLDRSGELILLVGLALLLLTGCGVGTHEQLDYPLVVIAKSQGNATHDFWTHACPCVTVVDADGDHYTDCCSGWTTAISETYNVGDTIR